MTQGHHYVPGYEFPEPRDDYTDPLCDACGGTRADHEVG